MTLVETLETCDWRNLAFGCRPSLPPPSDALAGLLPGDADYMRQVEWYANVLQGPDVQTLGSCTCNAFCGLIEWHIADAHGRAVQLDYDRLYCELRKDRVDMRDSGAQLVEPFEAARRRGMIPAESSVTFRSASALGLMGAFETGPAVIGVSIHPGWNASRLHKHNGQVDEDGAAGLRWGQNGHAMLALGTNQHNGVWLAVLRNSWGAIGVKNKGLVSASMHHLGAWMIAQPMTIDLGMSWRQFSGFEPYIVREVAQ